MNIENLHLFRRRFIPDEITPLSDDKVLKLEENLIITSWKTLNPRTDFASGMSAYFIDKGWKVSKFLDCEGNIKYWYCDIIDCIVDEASNSFTYEDLLFDVVVYPNGNVKVLDCDEAAEAREKGFITEEQLLRGLRSMNELLTTIYHGRFDRLQAVLN
ncbi:MAG: DUF402 domain-containing protein [Lachnospiraceae bacterium]|jgi:protein associated with RNAse G/E|nr:DUF402 domain-containing protein [Lachnospiraceae bacterium]MCR4992881.1 DUF402 domain-containing protein [Lachnospiraceae bacterium]